MIPVLVAVLRLYQVGLSPLLPVQCRFQPSCSQYAIDSLRRYGLRRGLWRACRRLGRCHPFGGWGYDPID